MKDQYSARPESADKLRINHAKGIGMAASVLTPEQEDEWTDCMLNVKGDLMFHMNELLGQLEASNGLDLSPEIEQNLRIVKDTIAHYSSRSDKDKQDMFDPVLTEVVDQMLDMVTARATPLN